MAQDDSADILTNEDVKLLFESFPDLKEKFSENVSTKEIMDFMSKQAKECGIERGAHRLLEGLAVTCAMKVHAQIALGEKPDEQLLTSLHPANKQEFNKKLEEKQSASDALAVNNAECETIRDMSFTDVVSLLKVHNEVSNVFHKMPPKERGKFLTEENISKFANLVMIAGNETGEKQSLSRGYVARTFGQRLVHIKEPVGDKNEVFKSFAAMSRVTGYLQNKAAIELGRGCQTNRDELKKDINFFCLHATETITLLSSSENNKKRPEELKKAILLHVEAISSKEKEEKKEKEVKAIINTDGVCRKALDSYFETNERTGMCPQLVPPQQETPKDYSNGNDMIYNNAHNYKNYVRG